VCLCLWLHVCVSVCVFFCVCVFESLYVYKCVCFWLVAWWTAARLHIPLVWVVSVCTSFQDSVSSFSVKFQCFSVKSQCQVLAMGSFSVKLQCFSSVSSSCQGPQDASQRLESCIRLSSCPVGRGGGAELAVLGTVVRRHWG
jgi:hypothetical protein